MALEETIGEDDGLDGRHIHLKNIGNWEHEAHRAPKDMLQSAEAVKFNSMPAQSQETTRT